jgi:drug/metabolite transporter (DMT)-like permease
MASAVLFGASAPFAKLLLGSTNPQLSPGSSIGGGVGPLFLMLGLARTSAASGSLMLNLEGLATMAIAWVVFRENVDRKLMLGAAAILSGAVVLSWQMEGIQIDGGGLLIAVACLAWGIDNNLTRKLSSADPVVIALIKGVAAGATNLLLALFLGARLPSVGAIGLRSSSGSSASASVSCSSSWRCAISAAPGREPISRSRRFSARSSL